MRVGWNGVSYLELTNSMKLELNWSGILGSISPCTEFRTFIFGVDTNRYKGDCSIQTYALDELAGTKLRALYQRKKGRDLFDIAELMNRKLIDPDRTVNAYYKYLDYGGASVSQREFELNLKEKLQDPIFLRDMDQLKHATLEYDPLRAFESLQPLIALM